MDDRKWPRSYRIGPVVIKFATEEVVFKCWAANTKPSGKILFLQGEGDEWEDASIPIEFVRFILELIKEFRDL